MAVVVMCGIPASGKTHLSTLLNRSKQAPDVHIIHVCYDDHIPSNLDINDNYSWKYYRHLIKRCVETLINEYRGQKETFAKDLVGSNGLPSFSEFWMDFQASINLNFSSDACRVFLIDDNMFYRSMRHEYFLLARKCNSRLIIAIDRLGYAQVFVDCPLEVALKRNSSRKIPVHDNTMITMASKIEEPLPTKHQWESNTLKVKADWTDTDIILGELHKLIMNAVKSPVPQLEEENNEMKEQSRKDLLANTLYQTDQVVRKVISQKMKKYKEERCGKEEMTSMANNLNTKRRIFMEKLKNGFSSPREFNFEMTKKEILSTENIEHYLELHCSQPGHLNMHQCVQILKSLANDKSFGYVVECMFKYDNYDD